MRSNQERKDLLTMQKRRTRVRRHRPPSNTARPSLDSHLIKQQAKAEYRISLLYRFFDVIFQIKKMGVLLLFQTPSQAFACCPSPTGMYCRCRYFWGLWQPHFHSVFIDAEHKRTKMGVSPRPPSQQHFIDHLGDAVSRLWRGRAALTIRREPNKRDRESITKGKQYTHDGPSGGRADGRTDDSSTKKKVKPKKKEEG